MTKKKKKMKIKEYIIDSLILQILISRNKNSQRFHDVISEQDILSLLDLIKIELSKEPVLLELSGNFCVVGDIHGNIDDLIRIFEDNFYPPKTKYLFLGDYIDRGTSSLEVITLLFALKLKFPNSIYLIRGNHEIERISNFYGFYDEINSKYGINLYENFHKVFTFLPLCAILNETTFCVHGGIGPNLNLLSDLKNLEKPSDIFGISNFVDLLWSDPRKISSNFTPNSRGCGHYFSKNSLIEFLKNNNLKRLIRSHEVCVDGIDFPFIEDICITIFSNTNYCGKRNLGTVLNLNEKSIYKISTFETLNRNELNRKKVILPEWLIESSPSSLKLSLNHEIKSPLYAELEIFDLVSNSLISV